MKNQLKQRQADKAAEAEAQEQRAQAELKQLNRERDQIGLQKIETAADKNRKAGQRAYRIASGKPAMPALDMRKRRKTRRPRGPAQPLRQAQDKPVVVRQAIETALPPVVHDDKDTWNGDTPPPAEKIAETDRKPVEYWTWNDMKRNRWAADFDTNPARRDKHARFLMMNPGESFSNGPGHAQGIAPNTDKAHADEDRAINRHRGASAVGLLGPAPDPDHVRLVEEHYGLRTPQPQETRPLDYGETRTIETGTSTLTISRAPKPDPETYDPFDPLGYEESISGGTGETTLGGGSGDDRVPGGDWLDEAEAGRQGRRGSGTPRRRQESSRRSDQL